MDVRPKPSHVLVESPELSVSAKAPSSDSGSQQLRREARAAALKEHYARDLEASDIFASIKRPNDQPRPLTKLQKYVVAMTARGHTAREIARMCNRSVQNIANRIQETPNFDYWVDQFRLTSGIFNYNSEFQKAMPDAIKVVRAMMSGADKDATRLEAALRIIDRVMGRPKETVEHSGNLLRDVISRLDNSTISELSEDQPKDADDLN